AVVRQRNDFERGAARTGDSGVEVWRARRCLERDQLYRAAAGCSGDGAMEPAASGGEGKDSVPADRAGGCEGADYCGERLHEDAAGFAFSVAAVAAGGVGDGWIWTER